MKEDAIIIDTNGNVNDGEGEKRLQLSHNQQSRLRDVLKRYRDIKDSQSTLPPMTQQAGAEQGVINKVFEGEEFHRTSSSNNDQEESNLIRPFSGLSSHSDEEIKTEDTTAGL